MAGQIDGTTKARRASELSEAADAAFAVFVEQNKDYSHNFLAEEHVDGYVTGYTGNYIKVYIKDTEDSISEGGFYTCKIIQPFRDGALAELSSVHKPQIADQQEKV